MASAFRDETTSLTAELLAHPRRFAFFQAVRLVEAQAARGGAEAARLGEDTPPGAEPLRLLANASLAFGGHEVATLRRTESGRLELRANVMGLVGPSGVLPQHYTAQVIERLTLRDPHLRDFLDIFHHRALSLFYRAWLKYRFAYDVEREQRSGRGRGAFTQAVLSLVGLGLPGLQDRQALPDSAFALEAGHFARAVRTADGLARALCDVFRVPARVHEFVGRWLEIPPEERTVLPREHSYGDVRVQLGGGATLGAATWDVRSGLRVELGPLALREYLALAPGGAGHDALLAAVGQYVGVEMDVTIDLVLAAGESLGARLARTSGGGGSRLGGTAWLEHGEGVPGPRTARFAGGQPAGLG